MNRSIEKARAGLRRRLKNKTGNGWSVVGDGLINRTAGLAFKPESLGASRGGLPALPQVIADADFCDVHQFMPVYESALRSFRGRYDARRWRPDWRAELSRKLMQRASPDRRWWQK